jgi:glutamate-5-semialdehyde dehydrogenase
VPAGAIVLVAGGGREELAELATQEGVVDLIVPRGGEGLKAALKGVATVPVIYAASGNCHVYVDASADLDAAQRIVLDAKTQRPGVCNAAETLLVHADVAPAFLPRVLGALREAGVELRVDGRTHALAGEALAGTLADATDADWDTEFLARFTDGGQFGMGAEIGNSTQKLHARGPIGLRELCTFKYVVRGDGHVRG